MILDLDNPIQWVTDPPDLTGRPARRGLTLDVSVTAGENPLRGALLYYVAPSGKTTVREIGTDGTASISVRGGEAPEGYLAVAQLGRPVWEKALHQAELSGSGGRWSVSVIATSGRLPERFSGLAQIEWVADELCLTWQPPRTREVDYYAVSLGNLEEALFGRGTLPQEAPVPDGDWSWWRETDIDSSGVITKSVTFATTEPARYIRIPNTTEVLDGGGVAAARAVGIGSGDTIPWSSYNAPSYGTGTGVDGVTIDPLPGNMVITQGGGSATVYQNDVFIVEARATGTSGVNEKVTWSAAGPEIITSDGRRALVRAAGGTLTATSVADGGASQTLTFTAVTHADLEDVPAQPSGLSWMSSRPPGTAQLSWDAPLEPLTYHRLYAGRDGASLTPVADTYGQGLKAKLGGPHRLELRAVSATGNYSGAASFGLVEPDTVAALASGFMREALPAYDIAPGGSATTDLGRYIKLTGSAAQSALWSQAEARAFGMGPVGASVAGSSLSLSVGGGAEALDRYYPILIRITQEGLVPLWAGLLARVQPATAAGGPQVTAPAELAGGAAFEAGKLVGANAKPLMDEAWFPEIERRARAASVSVSGGRAAVSLSGSLDGTPEIAALEGDSGAALLVFPTDPGAESQAPQLPSGTISQIETPEGWVSYGGLAEAERPHQWRRCLTSSGELYDLSLFHPPEPLEYSAPLYYEDWWIDEASYPDDATLDPEKGVVVYRGGLESASSSSTTVAVSGLSAEHVAGETTLSWQLQIGGQASNRPVTVSIWPQGSPGQAQDYAASSPLTTELDAKTSYVADVGGTQTTFMTPRAKATAVARAARQADGTWEIRYTITASGLETWTDPYGTAHSLAQVTISASELTVPHRITLSWGDGETQSIEARLIEALPESGAQDRAEVVVGTTISPDAPVRFTREVYSGTRVKQLPYNQYAPGTYRAVPVGYLPAGMEGQLEDYVTVQFLGPGGTARGASVDVRRPAELAVELEITASGGQSPVVEGILIE